MDVRRRGGRLRRIERSAGVAQLNGNTEIAVAELEARLLAALAKRTKPAATTDLLRLAHIDRAERPALDPRLERLEAEGRVLRLKGDKLAVPAHLGLVAGTVHASATGGAVVRPDDPDEGLVYVGAKDLRPAMHGDRVFAKVTGRRRGRVEGKVERVLARAHAQLVGTVHRSRQGATLVPREQRITVPVTIPTKELGGAADGDVVVAKLTKYPGKTTDAVASVVRVLGPASDPRVETEAVIHAYNLPTEFPPEVLAAARRIPAAVPPDAFSRRLDLRGQPLVTIDGENARDFDDAVMVEPLGASFLLTVAVADVAAYVPPGGPIDVEARARGCSVYFPDRVVPMLPEELSNNICSLKPGEDRLVKTVRMEFDARGRLLAAAFHDALIRSADRLTYTQVKQVLVDKDPVVRQRLQPLVLEMLERAETLARLLIQRRRQRGAIDFDLPEAEIVVDLRGKPTDIVRAERTIAHQMIEEFMLAANEAVAREILRRRLSALHRVHETPAPDAIRDVARFLEGFGLRLRIEDGKVTPAAVQAVLDEAAGRPEARLIHNVLLRAMKPARYAAEPIGHFGLATESYVHFTSPIRRYPDLVVHRILDVALRSHGKIPTDLPAVAEEASRRERVALEAERDIVQLKKVQFMQDKVGQPFDGFVSGVTSFGFFVELKELFVEGLVHVSSLGDDFYELVEHQHLLRGRKTRRTFRLGDAVRVEVAEVSVERRQIDFRLVEPSVDGGPPPRRRPRR